MFRNELEQCEKLCETALRVSDGKGEEASMVLAEVKNAAFRLLVAYREMYTLSIFFIVHAK